MVCIKSGVVRHFMLVIGVIYFSNLSACIHIPPSDPIWEEQYRRAVEHYKVGRFSEAVHEGEKALQTAEEKLGVNHPAVAASKNALGLFHKNLGAPDRAEYFYKEALRIWEKQSEKSVNVSVGLQNLGVLFFSRGYLDQAKNSWTKAFEIREELLKPDDPRIGISLNSLGVSCKAQNQFSKAETYYKRAVTIFQKLHSNHPYLAVVYHNLSVLYMMEGRYDEAEQVSKQALAIRKKNLGETHPDVAQSLRQLARIYQVQGQNREEGQVRQQLQRLFDQTQQSPYRPPGTSIFWILNPDTKVIELQEDQLEEMIEE